MTITQILTDARDLIADRRNWGRTYYAQTAEGEKCPVWEKAERYCMMGAYQHVICQHLEMKTLYGNDEENMEYRKLEVACYERLTRYIPNNAEFQGMASTFNDRCTHKEVMKIYARGINHNRLFNIPDVDILDLE